MGFEWVRTNVRTNGRLQIAAQDKTGEGVTVNGLSADVASFDLKIKISLDGIDTKGSKFEWAGKDGNYNFESEFSASVKGGNLGVKHEFSLDKNNALTKGDVSATASYKGFGGEASYDYKNSEGSTNASYQQGVKFAIGLGLELSGDATLKQKK